MPTPAPTATPSPAATVNASDPACFDDAYNLSGFSWNRAWEWHYNTTSTPDKYDSATVLAVIQSSVDHITSEYNDCGRPDSVSAQASYQGDTALEPCGDVGDGTNVIGWGKMPADLASDTIAYTCPYYFRGTRQIAEADIVISTDVDWALSTDRWFFQELLEPTITHETGHVFGLDHVGERQHPDLTMSTDSNGACNDDEATLGLGDMLGLEKLYPVE